LERREQAKDWFLAHHMKSNEKKQQIIDAAIKVISNQGIEKTSVREIAAAAGLTTGAIYYHYKNKEELFQDVVNESIHFSHKISEKYTNKAIPRENLLNIIVSEVSKRLEKDNEQKLHIALMSDIIAKKDAINQQYIDNYKQIIKNTGDLFAPAFGIENNEEFKYLISSILIAALDGMAIQQSLGVYPDEKETVIEIFNTFFTESIPEFLQKHKK